MLMVNASDMLLWNQEPSPYGKLGLPQHTHQQRLSLCLSQPTFPMKKNVISLLLSPGLPSSSTRHVTYGTLNVPNTSWIPQLSQLVHSAPSLLMVTSSYAGNIQKFISGRSLPLATSSIKSSPALVILHYPQMESYSSHGVV